MVRIMRRALLVGAAVAAVVAALVSGGGAAARSHGRSAPSSTADAAAVRASNRLALALLPRLGNGGNLVFSPYSIQAALAMVDQGAAGQTATQLGHVLGTPNSATLAAAEAALSGQLRTAVAPPAGAAAAEIAHLLIANGLWVAHGLSLEPPFQNTLSNDFGAAPQTLDFGAQPDAARQTINDWVAQHTAQLIKNLMPPGTIDNHTALVLANAIYLKAHWASPFTKSETSPRPFTTATGQRVTAPFMTQDPFELPYTRTRAYTAIEMPYEDSTLSMLAVMPSGTIGHFQRKLTPAALARLTGSLRPRFVDLRMPRFQLALHSELNDALSALGMPVAFTDAADFSRITHDTGLKVQAVEHGAVLKVDEQGTVAAAATGISLTPTAIRIGPSINVTLNHPFLLFLRDDRTGAILFAARVVDPR
jgi:serpin B